MAMAHRFLLVEDDAMTRELLLLLLQRQGRIIAAVANGKDAVQWIAAHGAPEVVLSDLHLPDMAPEALGLAFYAACGGASVLIAMSATAPKHLPKQFHSFLQKPFDIQEFDNAVAGATSIPSQIAPYSAVPDLSEEVYGKLLQSFTKQKIAELYAFALDDAERRIHTLQQLAQQGVQTAFQAEAHALKGSCSMVGAVRLHAIAGQLEETGITLGTTPHLGDLLIALKQLRSILAEKLSPDSLRKTQEKE